jgi:hypothetical protein
MYQPYPGGAQVPDRAPGSAPESVRRAAVVMYVGAAASLISIVVDFTARHIIRAQLLANNHKLTATQLNNGEHAVVAGLALGGLIAAGLWIWMAISCKAGKAWARIVSTVLFCIATIQVLGGLKAPFGAGVRIAGLVVWVIGLVAIVLLWQRESTAYFKGASQY